MAGLIQTPFAKLLCFHDQLLHSKFSKVSEHTDHDDADEHTHSEASHVHKHRHSPDEPEHEHPHSHLATSFYDYSIYFKVAPAHEYPLVVEHQQFGNPSDPKLPIVNADIFRPPICA
ncbi:MAG: hypothetical protein A2Z20_09825 [Bdellovibrionales bacterium RBG_16_40_8]|nr:MAG: hypothetical protein A2Z20_09825 [Bdellovibrionales bacterium RBG_16_40_8]